LAVDEPPEGEREGETKRLWIPVDGCELRAENGRRTVMSKVEKNGRAAESPEVLEKAKRRTYTAEYKIKILREADECERGELGALLRREGLYSSLLTVWRQQRDEGTIAGLEPKKRGRKERRRHDAVALENERLRKENARLERRLKQAELIIDVQKKVSQMLGIPLKSIDDDGSDS
jgi:transposase-like protein